MEKHFPPFRSCVPSLQTPAWGVFGLTSERKASVRSTTGAGEASGTQAGPLNTLPTCPGQPSSWILLLPGCFLLWALLPHKAEKESA